MMHEQQSIVKVCRECGDSFTVTEGEVTFLTQRGLRIFERCQPCRAERKRLREQQEAASR